jgi:hypothetical protein
MMGRFGRLLPLTGAVLFGALAASAPDYVFRPLGALVNGGDDSPILLSGDFTGNRLANLDVGETAAVAEGNGFAMARADKVDFQVLEKIPVVRGGAAGGANDDGELAAGIDLDGDGKPDVNGIGAKAINFQALKFAKTSKGEYVKSLRVEVAPGTPLGTITTSTTFVVLFVNTGKAVFTGKATFLDHLDSRITVVGTPATTGAVDQRRANAALSWVPVLNLFSGGNDLRWGSTYDTGIFLAGHGTWKRDGDILRFDIPDLVIKPGQGVAITFEALIEWGKAAGPASPKT